MSTKNLARTVIEGGRSHYNCFSRRHSNAVERNHARQLLRGLCSQRDPETALFEPRQRREFWVSTHGILRYAEPSPKRRPRE